MLMRRHLLTGIIRLVSTPICKEVKTGTYDIVTCPNPFNCYDLYKMMADEGILLPLNDFLESKEEGEKLEEAYPSVVWETMEYKGEIYGILTPDMQMNYYAVFNKKYADKYGIDLSQVTFAVMEKISFDIDGIELRGRHVHPDGGLQRRAGPCDKDGGGDREGKLRHHRSTLPEVEGGLKHGAPHRGAAGGDHAHHAGPEPCRPAPLQRAGVK